MLFDERYARKLSEKKNLGVNFISIKAEEQMLKSNQVKKYGKKKANTKERCWRVANTKEWCSKEERCWRSQIRERCLQAWNTKATVAIKGEKLDVEDKIEAKLNALTVIYMETMLPSVVKLDVIEIRNRELRLIWHIFRIMSQIC